MFAPGGPSPAVAAVPRQGGQVRPQLAESLAQLLGGAADGLSREEVGEGVAELVPVKRFGEHTVERLGELRQGELDRVVPRQVDDGRRPQGLDIRPHHQAILRPREATIQEDGIRAIGLHRGHRGGRRGGPRHDLMPHLRDRVLEGQGGNRVVFHDEQVRHREVPLCRQGAERRQGLSTRLDHPAEARRSPIRPPGAASPGCRQGPRHPVIDAGLCGLTIARVWLFAGRSRVWAPVACPQVRPDDRLTPPTPNTPSPRRTGVASRAPAAGHTAAPRS
jgi:hypothetical protein